MSRSALRHRVNADEIGRLDALVARLTELPRAKAQRLIRGGAVRVNAEPCLRDFHRTAVGDRVEISFDPDNIPRAAAVRPWRDPAFRVVHEDESLVVVNKAAGVLTVPTGPEAPQANTLLGRVNAYLAKSRAAQRGSHAHLVHRLDQATTGLLVFAKSAAVARQLRDQFEDRKPHRVYHAIVAGRVALDQGTFRSRLVTTSNLDRRSTRDPDRGQLAVTHYRVMRRYADFTHVTCRLETGRRNQIRVHFAEAGHPVLGDPRYRPDLAAHPRWPRRGRGIALHAAELGFTHPATGESLHLTSPLPVSFLRLLGRVEGDVQDPSPRRRDQ